MSERRWRSVSKRENGRMEKIRIRMSNKQKWVFSKKRPSGDRDWFECESVIFRLFNYLWFYPYSTRQDPPIFLPTFKISIHQNRLRLLSLIHSLLQDTDESILRCTGSSDEVFVQSDGKLGRFFRERSFGLAWKSELTLRRLHPFV